MVASVSLSSEIRGWFARGCLRGVGEKMGVIPNSGWSVGVVTSGGWVRSRSGPERGFYRGVLYAVVVMVGVYAGAWLLVVR